MLHRIPRTLFFALMMLTLSCAIASAEDKSPKVEKPKKLEPAKCGKVQPLHVLDDIYLAGQPSREDFQAFKERGVKAVVNLRTKEELDWDEAKVLKDLDLQYHHIPIKSADALTDETFDKLRKVFNDRDERPLLVHCAVASRVGAVWLAHRVLDDGVTYEAALAEAKTVGLKHPALEAKAKDYIARQKSKKPAADSDAKNAPKK